MKKKAKLKNTISNQIYDTRSVLLFIASLISVIILGLFVRLLIVHLGKSDYLYYSPIASEIALIFF